MLINHLLTGMILQVGVKPAFSLSWRFIETIETF